MRSTPIHPVLISIPLPLLHPPQQALIITNHLPNRLLHFLDALGPLELDEDVFVFLVDALLDQQPPVVERAIVGVARARALRQARGAGLAGVRGDSGEEVHFDEAVELAGREFVFAAEGFEEGEVEQVRCRDADADAFGGEFGVDGGGEGDLGESAVGGEAGVVAVVAEVVEGFVGVFDGDFGAGGGCEEEVGHAVVEVGAVRVGLVGWEDEELGDAGAGGQF